MPCFVRMKTVYLRGLLWLYLLGFAWTMNMEPNFLDFDNLPDTNFTCVGKVIGGYYADLETNCQMFHVCTIGQKDESMDIRFLCLNGTVFDQETRVCERIDEVDCSKSEQFYSLNLELYGNTQPSLVEEPETDPPIKKTTTTTTTQRPTTTSRPHHYYTTTNSPPQPTTSPPKVVSSHHFPISSSGQSDIRFNPEEINISLHPGAPPDIRTKPVSFQQQLFGDEEDDEEEEEEVISTTQKPKSEVSYDLTHNPPRSNTYGTYVPNYNINHSYQNHQYRTSTIRTNPGTTRNYLNSHSGPTTFRNPYVLSSLSHYRTDKPQRLQLPLPLLPSIFSSPAPFSLNHRHVEAKRSYPNEHQPPPRIIISASASVSDQSGRKLNYSLGTLGVAPLLELPPKSYDDYKDRDVVLDPFYHDVPKINKHKRNYGRGKRDVNHQEVIKNEQEAVDVLKFLFDWYQSHEKSTTVMIPIQPEDITLINDKLGELNIDGDNNDNSEDYRESELFQPKHKFNIVGDVLSATTTEAAEEVLTTTNAEELIVTNPSVSAEYVDDNYEPLVSNYNSSSKSESDSKLVVIEEKTTVAPLATTVTTTRRRGRGRFSANRDSYQRFSTNRDYYQQPSTRSSRRRGNSRFRVSTTPKNAEEEETTTTPEVQSRTFVEETTTSPEGVTETVDQPVRVYYEYTTQPQLIEITYKIEVQGTTTDLSTLTTTIEDTTTPQVEEEETTTEPPVIEITYKNLRLHVNNNKEMINTSVEPVTKQTENWVIDTTEVESTTESTTDIVETTTTFPSSPTETTTTEEIITTPLTTTTTTPLTTTTTTTIEEIVTTPLTTTTTTTTTTTPLPTTTEETAPPPTTRRRNNRRRPTNPRRSLARHRFSSVEQSTPKVTPEHEIVAVLQNNSTEDEVPSSTDAPIDRSVHPTQAESSRDLNTTPLYYTKRSKVRTFVFNCFGKAINKFYSDPRDCRLFHYCTSGYNKNQLLDMKFVCDLGTYFDDERLICTKVKPVRCL